MLYNPSVYDRKRAVLNNNAIDPEINYFSTEIENNCTYYLTDEFIDVVDIHSDWKVQENMFSLTHINCSSFLGNFDDFVNFTLSLNNLFESYVWVKLGWPMLPRVKLIF